MNLVHMEKQVQDFLHRHGRACFGDIASSTENAQLLHEVIVKKNYTRCLEIGSNLGYGAIYMAWALCKVAQNTGTHGTLISIEYDAKSYVIAKANVREAGIESFVDLRQGDAGALLPQIEGSFDFAFCDGDHSNFINYFKILAPRINSKGCIITDNVYGWWWNSGAYREYIEARTDFDTSYFDKDDKDTIMSVCYKRD